MPATNESTPGAAPLNAAPTSQDREVIAAEQDAAWADDATDTASGTDAAAPEKDDADVITDKAALAAAVPAPKPGAAGEKPAGEADAGTDTRTPEEKAAAEAEAAAGETVTPEQKAETYWGKLGNIFPNAKDTVASAKFAGWFAGLSEADKAIAADLDKPDEAVKLMGRYYDDLAAGKVKEPEPPAPPKAFDLTEHITARKIGERKVTLPDGTETTLGELASPSQYGEVLAAVGAITSASEQSVMEQANQLIQGLVDRGVLVTGQRFEQLLEKLGEKDLAGKVADAPALVNTPAFKDFVGKSKLLQAAWATRDADQRADVVALFRADQARAAVADVGGAQRRAQAAKSGLHKGALRGGPAAGTKATGEPTTAEAQDAAWETEIDVEGQKV